MKLLTCVLVDDEPLALEVLKTHLGKLPHVHMLASFDDPFQALHFLQTQPAPDVLFLDITMPGLTGFELAPFLKSSTNLIFTTAHREFALQGFEHDAVDYLVKPVSFERLAKAVAKVVGKSSKPSAEPETFLYLKIDKAMVKVNVADIEYLESLRNYVKIKTTSRELVGYYSLTYLEEKLPAHQFLRVQKSFIINLAHVQSFTAEQVTVGQKEIPLGRQYKEDVLRWLHQKSI
ncbi:LytTR family DNA-binding domain-containing protein [Rufibacter sp. LB8]|uniref:LytR/AlgR family response regulator transcription factor n=1 Tax=Rufibacter sp. LB8 TaxID=2777781 RepID=UPI00178C2CE3|nr:LytTR family DNA-binding domain-containing protein [Rufibacter sp. LB8]